MDADAAARPFEFSIAEHVLFLNGYFDAVGRVLTTDSELWSVSALDANQVMDGNVVFGAPICKRTAVENWSREFGSLVEGFLKLDQRSRLGFYLIDYVCWFKEFSRNAKCFKLECEPLQPGTRDQALYLLQLEESPRVLIVAQRLDKSALR